MLERLSFERWLVLIFGAILSLSFAASLLILVFGIPLGLTGDEAMARGQVSLAISTGFALVLGLIAILVALRVESASFKASQKTRKSLSQLVSLLLAALRVSADYFGAGGSKTGQRVPDYAEFKQGVRDFHFGETGLAMSSWISSIEPRIKKNEMPKEWRIFFMYLVLIDRASSPEGIASRCVALLNLLSTLRSNNIRAIASRVHNLDKALGSLPNVIEGDVLIKATVEMFTEDNDDVNEIFQYIKSKGVVDPNIDLFIAVTGDVEDVQSAKKALDAGADPSVTTGHLISKYRLLVEEYRAKHRPGKVS